MLKQSRQVLLHIKCTFFTKGIHSDLYQYSYLPQYLKRDALESLFLFLIILVILVELCNGPIFLFYLFSHLLL